MTPLRLFSLLQLILSQLCAREPTRPPGQALPQRRDLNTNAPQVGVPKSRLQLSCVLLTLTILDFWIAGGCRMPFFETQKFWFHHACLLYTATKKSTKRGCFGNKPLNTRLTRRLGLQAAELGEAWLIQVHQHSVQDLPDSVSRLQ